MKYVSSFKDRHGIIRYRFRKAGCKAVYLKHAPGTPEFENEYRRCLETPKEPIPYREPSSLVFQLDVERVGRGRNHSGPHIYFVEAENGLIKIGHSANLRERFKKLQTASAVPLRLLGFAPGSVADERGLHTRFADRRVRGEWFSATDEIRRLATGTNGEQGLTENG